MFLRSIKTRFRVLDNPLKNVDHLKNVVFFLKNVSDTFKNRATVKQGTSTHTRERLRFCVCVAKTLLVDEFVSHQQFSFLVLILYIISVI